MAERNREFEAWVHDYLPSQELVWHAYKKSYNASAQELYAAWESLQHQKNNVLAHLTSIVERMRAEVDYIDNFTDRVGLRAFGSLADELDMLYNQIRDN